MFKILLPIIIIGVAVGLFFLETQPIMNQIADIEKTRIQLSNAEASSEQYQQLLKEKNVIYNQIDEVNKAKITKFLPDSIDNVKLIIDINQIASDNGMTIRNISIKGNGSSALGPDSRPYGVATLGFSVSGPYETFKKFLSSLETSLRLIDVASLSFTAGDKNQYEYNLEVKSYWLK